MSEITNNSNYRQAAHIFSLPFKFVPQPVGQMPRWLARVIH